MTRLAFVVVAGCGRLGFGTEPVDTLADSTSLAPIARYSMDEAPVTAIAGETAEQDAPCGPCPTQIAGKIGNAIQFDGTLRVELPGATLIGLAPFTVAAWIQPDNVNLLMSAISKPRDVTGLNNTLSLTVGDDGITRYESSVANEIVTFPSGGPDLRGAWHHVAASWDGIRRRLHIDGELAGEMPGAFEDSNLAIGIGADLDGGTPAIFYAGGMDELRFYDRALTDAEIADLAKL